MTTFLYEYEQVSVDAVVLGGMSFAPHGELHSVLHSGRDVDLDRGLLPHQAGASAVAAGILDDLALSVAV